MPTAEPSWTTRVWQEFHAGTLTRAYRDTLLTLKTYRGLGGLICPSHETLADRAGCSVSTVQRALKHARTLGLVMWAERRVRASWRWLRTSNSYVLVTPAADIDPGLMPQSWRRHTNVQKDRREESQEIKKTPTNEGRIVRTGRQCMADAIARVKARRVA